VIDAVIDFYGSVFQDLQAFVPRAPALERLHKTSTKEIPPKDQNPVYRTPDIAAGTDAG